jgi:2-phospho-L-lactate guanylyltransferase
VIVPVRGFGRGKSRLAPVLDPQERMRLNRQLLRHSLAVIGHAFGGLHRCIVVSACARSLHMARSAGALAVSERRPQGGLNAAIHQSVGRAVLGGARRVLILPSDLPLMSVRALEDFTRSARPPVHVAIAPDRARTGTNALLLRVPSGFRFCFGPESFQRHLEAARTQGWASAVCDVAALAADLDTPEQRIAWMRGGARWGR